ncbi:MAG: hypothetical protein RL372_400 [Bacteroidota bacterium]|jgi:hypothetical protein
MKKIILLISFFATILIGCDKEISLVLDNNNPTLVIDGNITDQAGPYFVQLSLSTPITTSTTIVGVNNARITITDQLGVKDSLLFVSNGLYKTQKIKGIEGGTYNLEVIVDQKKYTASATMPKKVNLDSLRINTFPFNGEIRYSVIPVYSDPISLGNSYRFIQKINDTLDPTFHVFDDNLNNGKVNQRPLRGGDDKLKVKLKDNVFVEMQCISNTSYLYYNSLNQQSGAGPGGGTAPSNPPSNIEGGALGIFSAHTVQRKTIRIN